MPGASSLPTRGGSLRSPGFRRRSIRELDPAHLAAGADRGEAEVLDAVRDAAQLDGVVDPDVWAVFDDKARLLLVHRLALGLAHRDARFAQELVPLRVLVPGRGLP